jgi:hypothetical protein
VPRIRRRLRGGGPLGRAEAPRLRQSLQLPRALICSVANLLVALGGIALAFVVRNAVAGLLLTVVATPPLFVLTLYFAVRDLCALDALPAERRSAWLALTFSSVPLGLLVGLARSVSERLLPSLS